MNQKTTTSTPSPAHLQIVKLLKESAFLVLLAVSLFLLGSLFSYHVDDPGWTHSGTGQAVLNITGVVGAWIADFMLSIMGFMAFALPFMLMSSAWKFLSEARSKHVDTLTHQVIRWVSFIVFLVAGAGLLDMHYYQRWLTIPGSPGGIIGLELTDFLIHLFAFQGATLILLSFFLIGITLSTGLSWLGLMDKLGALSIKAFRLLKAYIEDSKERKTSVTVKKQRSDSFKKQSKIFAAKPKARIEPVIREIKSSERVEKERQVALFDEPAGALPGLALLDKATEQVEGYSKAALEALSKLVELKLQDFGVEVDVVAVNPGPVITRFEIQPAPGIKASRISGLAQDLARSMSTHSVRVVEVIPGKSVIGLEIPNEAREMVRLSEILSSQAYEKSNSPLTLVLGKDISGQPTVADLAKMPHLLVAGTTGSGKSVAINAMILSLLYKATPEQVRMIMIDPKMLELSVYEGIPHLLTPVVTDMKEASNALRWSVAEMERRYKLMSLLGVRNLSGYNKKVRDAIKEGSPLADPLWEPTPFIDEDEAGTLTELPQIVIIIDELADMMMVVGKKVEELIARLAQKARASGLHLVLATQRPSVDVLTGLIKANIPSRIAFQVSSKIDSRTILDQSGAESLLGNGDMLYLPPGSGLPQRVHGAFVDDHEVHKVVKQLKKSGKTNYIDGILTASDPAEFDGGGSGGGSEDSDELYDQALKIVTETRRASISGVQRQLRVGYNRAARMIEEMERCGVVGPLQSNGSREVLAPPPPEL
ncbi:DNA translocase FtsK [Cycloclasticus pugetii]|uniref:DNA translocase FtsK n=1 Tax=Cycloclasticus pugetii TaxID=34068 RepID=UPI000911C55D|nr:DNA translocase FtsK [Cycloclasticus pugetii]SHJ38450.1 DNA translocase FtsK [Cycloclasticus pugetii]